MLLAEPLLPLISRFALHSIRSAIPRPNKRYRINGWSLLSSRTAATVFHALRDTSRAGDEEIRQE